MRTRPGRSSRRRVLATAAVLLAVAAPSAAACPKTTLGDVEDEVMCPVCGTPLALATEAPQAQRERELIRRLVDGCRSKDEVKAVLAAEFGEDVLALPEAEGFDLAAYLVPGLAILMAGGAVGVSALRWRRGRAEGAAAGGGEREPAGEAPAEPSGGGREPSGSTSAVSSGGEREPAGSAHAESGGGERQQAGDAPPPEEPPPAAARRLQSDLDRYEL